MSGPSYVQTRDGVVTQASPEEAKKLLESGDYLPATAADQAAQEKAAKDATFSSKAKTFAESAAAGAIDAAQAPIALPLRAGAALLGAKDPMRDIGGRATVESLVGMARSAVSDRNMEAESREYGENTRERAEAHPAIAMAGNLAGGVVGGAAMAGGAGALGGATTEALGGGLAARAVGAVASGAAEGAAYGQAQAGDEAYLNNVPLSAEKLVASMGWGALIGGGVSLAAHAASGAFGMVRNGSRGATPLDSPRMSTDIGGADAGSVAGDDVKMPPAADHAPGAPPTDGASAIESAVSTGPEGKPVNAEQAPGAAETHLPENATAAPSGAEPRVEAPQPDIGTSTPSNDVELPGVPTRPPGTASSWLRDFSNERALNAAGFRGAVSKKLGRTAEDAMDKIGEMGPALKNATLEDGTPVFQGWQTQGELRGRIGQAYQESEQKLAAFRERADAVIDQHPEIAPDVHSIADRIEQEVIKPIQNHPSSVERAGAGPIQQFADDVRAVANRADEGTAGSGLQDLTALRMRIDKDIYNLKTGVNIPQMGAAPDAKALERAKWILEDAITASSDKAATFMPKGEAASYKALKTQSHLFRTLNDQAGAEELQAMGRRIGSPSDYGAGIAGAAMGGGPLGALGAMAANKVVREHASSVAAVLADKLANTLDGKIDSGLGSFFRESSARATAGTSGVANAIASLPSVPIRRIATPAAVDAFMGRSKDLPAAYQKRVTELVNITQNNSTGVRESVVSALGGAGDALPRLAAASTMVATKGAQYLQSQIPGSTVAPTVFQPTRKVAPSDLEIREFAQKWAAVANPLSVVDDLRRGAVTHAQIDAIKAVYPEMYAEIQTKTLEKLREQDLAGKSMPFADRLQLDLFLDLNGAGEPTLAGQFVDHVVSLQEQAAKQQNQAPAGGNSGKPVALGDTRKSAVQSTLGG